MSKPLTIYKASAGSGKTFTLAVEYIKLLIRDPQNFRYTLAVTFTNKATEEMKTRILGKLYGIANSLPDADDYMEQVSKAFPEKNESHMCDKAYDRTRKELKEAMDVIKDTEGSANTGRAISIYNAKVIGIHQYFQLATMISEDVSKISYEIQHKCKSRKLERRIEQTGRTKQGYIEKIYGASKQLRYINEVAIAPIGYCKHKNPMYKKKKVNKYTPEGRELIYKNISVSQTAIQYMLNNPIENRSIEYNDNRISLYVGQQGKCAVTGNVLDFYNMHCHHKIPRKMGGTDEYNNLVIVEREVHTLIHVVDEEVIAKLLGKLSLDKKKLAKLNTLRTKSGNKAINW